MKRPALLFLFTTLLLIGGVASTHAQSGTPATYTLKVYNQGATVPFQSTSVPATAAVCNATPTPLATGQSTTAVNPKGVEWDDPINTGKACSLDFSAFFGGLPAGAPDTATLSYVDTLGLSSGESNQTGPFVRALAGASPAHVRVVGGK